MAILEVEERVSVGTDPFLGFGAREQPDPNAPWVAFKWSVNSPLPPLTGPTEGPREAWECWSFDASSFERFVDRVERSARA